MPATSMELVSFGAWFHNGSMLVWDPLQGPKDLMIGYSGLGEQFCRLVFGRVYGSFRNLLA